MKVYLASGASNRILIEAVRILLEKTFPIEVVSTWHRTPSVEKVKNRAIIDFREIDIADTVIAFYPYGLNGTICELTYSFCKKKQTFYVRPEGTYEEDPLITGLFNSKFLINSLEELFEKLKERI